MSASSPTAPSTVARLAAQAARLEAATAAVVGHLTSALPSLGRLDAEAALVTAVPIPTRGAARYLEELAGHLAAHPDALTSGSSLCPPVLLRLAEVLHDAGHSVVRPGCAHCGKIRSDLRQLRPEGRLCGSCDARSRKPSTWPPEPRTNRQTPFKPPTNLARLFFAHSGGDRHGPAIPAHRTVRARPPRCR